MPIRIRLTLAFVLAMALVLAATGLFLYFRLASELDRTIDQGLRARAADVAALVEQADEGLREARSLRGPDDGFAQVVGPGGAVVDSTPGLADEPLLTAGQLDGASRGATFFVHTIDGRRLAPSRADVPAAGSLYRKPRTRSRVSGEG